MRPEDAIAPQDKMRNLRIIYNDGDWSVATFEYRQPDSEHWTQRVGMRWNGEEGSFGHPQIGGNGLWFHLPENLIAELVLAYANLRARGGEI